VQCPDAGLAAIPCPLQHLVTGRLFRRIHHHLLPSVGIVSQSVFCQPARVRSSEFPKVVSQINLPIPHFILAPSRKYSAWFCSISTVGAGRVTSTLSLATVTCSKHIIFLHADGRCTNCYRAHLQFPRAEKSSEHIRGTTCNLDHREDKFHRQLIQVECSFRCGQTEVPRFSHLTRPNLGFIYIIAYFSPHLSNFYESMRKNVTQ
jgi:hypothetical protein